MRTPGNRSPKFFFNPLKSPFLGALTGTHLLLAIVLGKIFAFAPDESGYLQIFKGVYKSGFSTALVLGWSNSQTFFLRIVYAPAKVLTMVGVSDSLAIRVLAILTSGMAIYLLMCVARFENRFHVPRLYQIVLFTPSLFLWMTLGLRESFIYLALSMICIGFFLIVYERGRIGFVFLLFGNLTLFETKSYLFLLVAIASLAQVIFVLSSRGWTKSIQVYVLLAVILPAILNPLGVKYLSDSIKSQLSSFSSTGRTSIAPVANTNSATASENTATTTSGLKSAILDHPDSLFSKILTDLGFAGSQPPKASSSTQDTSHYLTSRLNVTPAKISNPISIVSRTGGFLFTPFPFIDNGSLFLNLASLEFPFWWFLYAASGVALWRGFRHRKMNGLFVFVLSFSMLFVVFSAFTEINVGTMARHRSVLVIPLLYLLVTNYKPRTKNLVPLT